VVKGVSMGVITVIEDKDSPLVKRMWLLRSSGEHLEYYRWHVRNLLNRGGGVYGIVWEGCGGLKGGITIGINM